MSAIKAIRAKCIDCMCGQILEVKHCPIPDCPLYPYRMGHDPARKGKGGRNLPAQTEQENLHGNE
jgi:hypothetical protein